RLAPLSTEHPTFSPAISGIEVRTLDSAERRALRAKAHALHPTVMIGSAGLTGAVLKEIDLALKSREPITVRMLGDDRKNREDALQAICDALDAAPVQMIGKILVVFRPLPEETPAPVAAMPVRRQRGRAKRGRQ